MDRRRGARPLGSPALHLIPAVNLISAVGRQPPAERRFAAPEALGGLPRRKPLLLQTMDLAIPGPACFAYSATPAQHRFVIHQWEWRKRGNKRMKNPRVQMILRTVEHRWSNVRTPTRSSGKWASPPSVRRNWKSGPSFASVRTPLRTRPFIARSRILDQSHQHQIPSAETHLIPVVR